MIYEQEEIVLVDEYYNQDSFILAPEELVLLVPISVCNCGGSKCNGFFVKTHVGQTECFFSMQEKGLTQFLPAVWEFKSKIHEEKDYDEVK